VFGRILWQSAGALGLQPLGQNGYFSISSSGIQADRL
jgi:hypothetical protein